MKTQIFKTYFDFLDREDLTINGVSSEFAQQHPEWEKENESNQGCWNCSGCSDCSDCSRCSGCSGCSGLKNAIPVEQEGGAEGSENFFPGTPLIENIHTKVYDYSKENGHLDMSSWHDEEKFDAEGAHCGTTHCRAGTVVFLAGKAGRELEKKTSTLFAAQQIYKRSSPIGVTPTRFYDNNTVALADMKRCADEELKLSTIQYTSK